ncbi:MAG: helix-turn-helix domain-containing protein [Spirochaetaceae bacterium]|jgi:transcriptional regulator with XRE-family HTH domain|nr:helix-turn-helix domain-containing protein [Spirochaetaceae bacterium]
MENFAERLRKELEYAAITQKELAERAGIKKRALDMYFGAQKSMPAADVALKIARALGISVEYLITGEREKADAACENGLFCRQHYCCHHYKDLIADIESLPEDSRLMIKAMIKAAAKWYRQG